jgi:hypothetical protein
VRLVTGVRLSVPVKVKVARVSWIADGPPG